MDPSIPLEEMINTHSAVVYDTFAVEQASKDVEGESLVVSLRHRNPTSGSDTIAGILDFYHQARPYIQEKFWQPNPFEQVRRPDDHQGLVHSHLSRMGKIEFTSEPPFSFKRSDTPSLADGNDDVDPFLGITKLTPPKSPRPPESAEGLP